MKRDQLKVGMEVGYDCIPALMGYRGKVTEIAKQERGGDCKVQWARSENGPVVELSTNLRPYS